MSKLKKELKPINVWGLAFGAIIGTGCFFLPGNKFLPQSGPLGMVIGVLIGMAMVIIIGANYSFMISHYPSAGGEYIFTKKQLGVNHAYICGWFLALAYISLIPLNGTAATMILRYLFPGLLERGKLYTVAGWDVYLAEVIVSCIIIILLVVVNVKGVKAAGNVQTVIALLLVGSVAVLAFAIGLKGADMKNLQPYFASDNVMNCILPTLAVAPFLFVGFDCIPQAAEEYKFSHKKTFSIMLVAIIFAGFVYCAVNIFTALAMPYQELLDTKPLWATGTSIEYMLGKSGILLLGVAMMCAALSGINAFLLSASRLLYSMASEGAIPKKFAEINEKNKIPTNAIIFVAAISLIAPWFGREVLNWIVDMTSVGTALAFAYTSFVALRIAKEEKNGQICITGVLGTLFSIFFLVLLLCPGMPGALGIAPWIALIIWTILGIVFWAVRKKRGLV